MTAFSDELRAAMAARGMTGKELARLTGRSNHQIYDIRTEDGAPSLEFAVAMAEALDWDRLAELARDLWRRTCPECSTVFYINKGHQTYCSERCSTGAKNRRRAGRRERVRDKRLLKAHNLIVQYRESVAAYCRGCEPDGICREAECPLRSVSPLPFVRVNAA